MVVDNGHFSYGSNHWVVVSHHMLSLNTRQAGSITITIFIIKWRGPRERAGIFYHVDDISIYPGRQRGEGSPIERTYFAHTFCSHILHFKP